MLSGKKRKLGGSLKISRRINGLLRLVVGGVFLLAGVLKISDPGKFAEEVGNYRLLPHELNNLVAIVIPWIEVVAGIFVLMGVWLRAGAQVIGGLTLIFLGAILSALIRGLNIDCGCFGTINGQRVGLVSLAIDAALFFLATNLTIRSRDCLKDTLFSESGEQVSASPNEVSQKASSAN
jgi:uncharacterized membrane protein YphA (DoxX/SURF4 family)